MAKVKIPKRVAGVKIPKKVRKKAKKAIKLAESPALREAAVAALGAASTVRGAARALDRSDVAPRAPTGRIDGEALKNALRDTALDGVRRFLEGFEEGLRNVAAAAGDAADAIDEAAGGDTRRGNGKSNNRAGDAPAA